MVSKTIRIGRKRAHQIIARTRKLESEFNEIMSRSRLVKNVYGKPFVSIKVVDILEELYVR